GPQKAVLPARPRERVGQHLQLPWPGACGDRADQVTDVEQGDPVPSGQVVAGDRRGRPDGQIQAGGGIVRGPGGRLYVGDGVRDDQDVRVLLGERRIRV